MTTWNELMPGQQAYLDTLARAGKGWRRSPSILDASTLKDYIGLRDDLHLIETKLSEYTDFVVYERITPAGLLVWQQGQTPAEPDRNNVLVEYVLEVDMLCHAGEPLITTLINDHRRLREQVVTLTAERDALKAELESIEIHHAASWEAGYYAGFAAGKRAE